MITSIVSGIVAFASFGLYRSLVRFITGNIFIIITKSVLIGSSVLALFIVITDVNVPLTIPFIYATSLIFINWRNSLYGEAAISEIHIKQSKNQL